MKDEPQVPDRIAGNPIELQGTKEALMHIISNITGKEDQREAARWAGVVTLKDKRVADVGVFLVIREPEEAKKDKPF